MVVQDFCKTAVSTKAGRGNPLARFKFSQPPLTLSQKNAIFNGHPEPFLSMPHGAEMRGTEVVDKQLI